MYLCFLQLTSGFMDFFFFSSRRRHTRLTCDWSSDVCSSDLHRTRMVEGTLGSHHKEGSRKMSKHSMICAGIDTGKRKLDVALDGRAERLQVDNSPDGHRALSVWLRERRVKRIGIEASGGYEQLVVAHLRRDKFQVVMLQP